jgi:hypothetical protein
VSFDILIQRFARGDAADVDVVLIREALREFVTEELAEDTQSITTADGGADIYGLGSRDGLTINHTAGYVIWDAVVSIADAADLTIIPVGCPAFVTRPELLDELPTELRDQTRVVSTGLELRQAIAG